MSVKPDLPKPLDVAIKELMDDRVYSCGYYSSPEYEENKEKASILLRRIEEGIGEELWKQVFKDYLALEHLQGELHAGLSESCYRLGFNDALRLAREMDQACKGHLNIFI